MGAEGARYLSQALQNNTVTESIDSFSLSIFFHSESNLRRTYIQSTSR